MTRSVKFGYGIGGFALGMVTVAASAVFLQAFLGLGATPRDDTTRVVAIREGEFFSGLLVSAVSGLQQIDSAERTDELPEVAPSLREFLTGAFRVEDGLRPVFDFTRLAVHGEFMQAAA